MKKALLLAVGASLVVTAAFARPPRDYRGPERYHDRDCHSRGYEYREHREYRDRRDGWREERREREWRGRHEGYRPHWH